MRLSLRTWFELHSWRIEGNMRRCTGGESVKVEGVHVWGFFPWNRYRKYWLLYRIQWKADFHRSVTCPVRHSFPSMVLSMLVSRCWNLHIRNIFHANISELTLSYSQRINCGLENVFCAFIQYRDCNTRGSIESMEEFKYLGTTFTNQNSIQEEIRADRS